MEAVLRDNLDNPLDDNTMVTQQLEQMATIGRWASPSVCLPPNSSPLHWPSLSRCEYSKTCQLLVSLFDRSASAYQTSLQNPSPSPQELTLREGRGRGKGWSFNDIYQLIHIHMHVSNQENS